MLLIYLLFLLLGQAYPYDWTPLNDVMQEAMASHAFPGGVVAVANSTHTILYKNYGRFTYMKDAYEVIVANNTKYDCASVTKVMATTLAIMNLVSSKSISVDDPVSKYIKDYDTNKKGNTTVKNLLLHNAGLPYDYPGPLPKTQQDVIDYIRYIKPVYPVGTNSSYSNLGYLLLGKIVENITKKSFNDYTTQNRIFAGLLDSGFNPKSDFYRIPPTEYDTGNLALTVEIRKHIVRGEAHERLAYFFDGVAGHSGYFTTGSDLLRYMRILMNKGKLPEEARTLPESIIETFTTRVEGLPYNNTRALGFDTRCPTEKMKNCFGHDGSTGIMAWVDTDKKVAFAVLTNRGHPDVNNNLFFQTYKTKISHAIM